MNELFATRSTLDAAARGSITGLLNQQLADLLDLHSQLKNAHWNVRGPQFFSLHQLFDEAAGIVASPLDDLAERVTALGGRAEGAVSQAARASRLSDCGPTAQGLDLVRDLADRVALCANAARADIERTAALGDPGTADLLTQLSRSLDKVLWFLEAHAGSK